MGSAGGRVAHPYGELIELAERERALVANRDFDALAELVEARETLMADLPEMAPADAREAIDRLLELQRENDAALKQASNSTEMELSRLRTGRAGVRKYAPVKAPQAKRLDFSA
jgi:hypothetical protein